MMKKLLLALGLLFGFTAGAQASTCSTYPYTLTNGTTADANQVMANFNAILNCVNNLSTNYQGPGDVVSSALAWYGFRGYNKAYSGKAANVCLPADTACQDMLISNGNIVLTPIFGTSCTASTVVCTVKTLYDQTGNANCSGTCDVTQATIANRPVVVPNCIGTRPCMSFNASQGLLAAGNLAQAQPFTLSGIAERSGSFTTIMNYFDDVATVFLGFLGSANTMRFRITSNLTPTASDSSFHAAQAIGAGASSSVYVDGTSTAGTIGTSSFNGTPRIGGFSLLGFVTEAGIWGSAFNGTQQAAMNANQHAYWGF